jgi:1-acyl-sn-glycerol-3-phosphate acyltransferase
MIGYVGLFATGMFGSGVLVSANALLQKIVPDCFRGRVFGVKDVASVGGLLAATGVLAIPTWPGIDRYVPLLLLAVALGLLLGGFTSLVTRLRRGRFRPVITFWRNVTELHARLFARVRREGACTMPTSGPVILAANHGSVLDPFLLIATSPNRYPSFMIAREYAQWPLLGRLVRMIDCIPVNRTGIDTASVKAALRHLDAGRVLGIFPQGRIRHPDEPVELQEGVGLLALRSGATIVPAHVTGTRYSASVLTPFLRRHRAVVHYGPPVDLSAWKDRKRDRAAYREVARHIMDRINALGPATE